MLRLVLAMVLGVSVWACGIKSSPRPPQTATALAPVSTSTTSTSTQSEGGLK